MFKCFFFPWRCGPTRAMASSFLRFLDHTQTHHSLQDSSGRVISSSQRPLPDNTRCSQQTDIHASVGFEPAISAGERPQTYALDRVSTGTGSNTNDSNSNNSILYKQVHNTLHQELAIQCEISNWPRISCYEYEPQWLLDKSNCKLYYGRFIMVIELSITIDQT